MTSDRTIQTEGGDYREIQNRGQYAGGNIDPQLLQEALQLSDETTIDELIATALREYIQHHKQLSPTVPMISDAEQQEIEAELGTPADIEAEDFADLTQWTEHAGQLQ